MKPGDVIDGAIELLNQNGWCQNHYEANGRYCVAGALNRAAFGNSGGNQGTPYSDFATAHWKAVAAVQDAVGVHALALWNDAFVRTKEQVLAALEKAKDLVK